MRVFIKRMIWYAAWFGLIFLVFLPLAGPWLVSLKGMVATGHWIGWQMQEALRAFYSGLIITPFAALLFTIGEYGVHRGWWK